jgi:hypothetical protein
MLTFEQLLNVFRELGAQEGDTLLVHSSYKSLGEVYDGPHTVIRALETALGPGHANVATVLLASWPETTIEYYEDLQRAARYGPVLGKLVTLEEYFRVSRESDEWTRFLTLEYPLGLGTELGPNPISSHVDAYRRGIMETHQRLANGLSAICHQADCIMATRAPVARAVCRASPRA